MLVTYAAVVGMSGWAAPSSLDRGPGRAAPGGIGIGFRPEIAGEVLSGQTAADHLELLFEERNTSPDRAREGAALAEMFPIVLHGTKLSLGSAEGIDDARAARLGAYARQTRAFAVTEHAAFVRASGVEIGHLSPLPFSREAVSVLRKNVERARRHIPDVPLLLENIAWPFRPPGDELDEGTFHAMVADATGCDLLLDLGNLLANAKNAGEDPFALLARYPVERARMIHLAGGVTRGGFTYDTHAHAVPDEVFALLDAALARVGEIPIILERDHGFDLEIAPELDRARTIARAARCPSDSNPAAGHAALGSFPEAPLDDLAGAQRRLARALAGLEDAPEIERSALVRAREILATKRVEEALSLLPRLRVDPGVRQIALAHVTASPRPRRRAPVADARAIAHRAAREPRQADAAALDGLALDARFAFGDRGAEPRSLPFVGSARTSAGRCFAVRGVGADARTHFFAPSPRARINLEEQSPRQLG